MTLTLTNTTQQADSGASQLSLNDISNKNDQDLRLIYPAASNDYRISVAIIPAGSKWHAGAHWHEDYDEYMRVARGRAKIRLGSEYKIFTPEDGDILIPKLMVHDVMRADVDAKKGEGDDEELWIEERSEPVDGSKELFFRHMFSIMADKEVFGWKMPLQLLLTMMYTDGYLVIVPGPAHWYVTHSLWAVVKFAALSLGLKPFYDEYTPERLKGIAEKLQVEGKAKKV
ncbi:hypothetical protein K505DRAFT_284477 [Melanomma pulvis-pyrius CBS 109.77]|uniref:Cupin 2 conserved barrel domain-containing protein n=1 Tax=Melanomma pulvis-pyrius CBS 109.77 TaxID=1314802 RepID=A0A6A6WYT6_9PLEO|nr:hypothetical protein K505DRAFT_284477 [Melanomma pulvis-pyrius CBS 109.77]